MKSSEKIFNRLVGLACSSEDEFISYDEKRNRLVFLDANTAAMVRSKEVDRRLAEWRQKESSRRSKSSEISASEFAALAVHRSDNFVKVAIVDKGQSSLCHFTQFIQVS